MKKFAPTVAIIFVLAAQAGSAQGDGYSQLVAKAQADLSAGNAAQALTDSQSAIGMNSSGWEAYVVAGGALQLEKQYEQAISDFSQALKLAPTEKQAGINGLLEKAKNAQTAANGGPSLEFTLNYINGSLSDCSIEQKTHCGPITVQGTKIFFKTSGLIIGSRGREEIIPMYFDAHDVDRTPSATNPLISSSPPFYIGIECYNGNKCMQYVDAKKISDRLDDADGKLWASSLPDTAVNFEVVGNSSKAQDVANAFRHLFQLVLGQQAAQLLQEQKQNAVDPFAKAQ